MAVNRKPRLPLKVPPIFLCDAAQSAPGLPVLIPAGSNT